jgi:hypothetical protein
LHGLELCEVTLEIEYEFSGRRMKTPFFEEMGQAGFAMVAICTKSNKLSKREREPAVYASRRFVS